MASLQNLKKRLQGIGSIHQMTQAMELVAATKMRRAQEAALSSRPYALTALEILANLMESVEHSWEQLGKKIDFSQFPLLNKRAVKTTAILLIAADKGLAGSFNGSVFKKLERFLAQQNDIQQSFKYIAVGQKSVDYLKRKGVVAEAQFIRYGDFVHIGEVEPLSQLLSQGYETEAWDSVVVFSTNFVSALRQEVSQRQVLPLDFAKIRASVEELIPETGRFSNLRQKLMVSRPAKPVQYLIEPSPAQALNTLLPLLFTMQIYHIILETNASEHSARRMAMKNATDNAADLISNLTLEYNRSRQAVVTKEINEITGTTAALNK